jgi:PAS domain-containing protein
MGGSAYNLLVSLQLYPHFDKHGKIAGVVLEAEEVSEQVLQAQVAAHVFQLDEYGTYCAEELEYTAFPDYQLLYDADAEELLTDELAELEPEYGCHHLRKMHGPMVGLNKLLRVEAVTRASLMILDEDGVLEADDVCGQKFTEYLAKVKARDFKEKCQQVIDTKESIIIDTQTEQGGVVSSHKAFSIAPWYDEKANVKGTIIGLMGSYWAAFEIDSDGYVTDCTREAAATLGYQRSEINGKCLLSFVDQDSKIAAFETLATFVGENHNDVGADDSEVNRIYMLRKTKRVLQTTWDVFIKRGSEDATLDKKNLIVVMHKEKIVRAKARVEQKDEVEEDEEEVKLTAMTPVVPEAPKPEGDKVELSPVERAQQHHEPVKYHFAVMQKWGDINQPVYFKNFRSYLAAIQKEERPWELHMLNVFWESKLQKKFSEILSSDPDLDRAKRGAPVEQMELDFKTWEVWWNKSENRTKWDGGVTMTHTNPPGKMDPFEFDKK